MKYFLFFIPAFMFSCSSMETPTLDYLNEGLKYSTESIISFRDDEKSTITTHSYESDLKNNKHKQSFDKTIIKTQQIKDLLQDVRTAKKESNFKDNNLKDYSKKLHLELHSYINFIDSIAEADSIELLNIVDTRRFILNQDNQFSKYELELIASNVEIITYHIFKHYSRKIITPYYKPNKLKVAVLPKTTLLKKGELFETEIRIFAYDSLAQFEAKIEDKHIQSMNGMALFIDSSFNKARDVHKIGTLKIKDPYDDYHRDYPFTINYK